MDVRLTNVESSSSGQKVRLTFPPTDDPIHAISETSNTINEKHGGYENVSEFIPIGQPNASTLAKLDTLQPSDIAGDRMSSFL